MQEPVKFTNSRVPTRRHGSGEGCWGEWREPTERTTSSKGRRRQQCPTAEDKAVILAARSHSLLVLVGTLEIDDVGLARQVRYTIWSLRRTPSMSSFIESFGLAIVLQGSFSLNWPQPSSLQMLYVAHRPPWCSPAFHLLGQTLIAGNSMTQLRVNYDVLAAALAHCSLTTHRHKEAWRERQTAHRGLGESCL